MTYQEVINGFDQLLSEVDDFLSDTTTEEGAPPLTDLNERLNKLCAAAMNLSGDEMHDARAKMKTLLARLRDVSEVINRVSDLQNQFAKNQQENAARAMELASQNAPDAGADKPKKLN